MKTRCPVCQAEYGLFDRLASADMCAGCYAKNSSPRLDSERNQPESARSSVEGVSPQGSHSDNLPVPSRRRLFPVVIGAVLLIAVWLCLGSYLCYPKVTYISGEAKGEYFNVRIYISDHKPIWASHHAIPISILIGESVYMPGEKLGTVTLTNVSVKWANGITELLTSAQGLTLNRAKYLIGSSVISQEVGARFEFAEALRGSGPFTIDADVVFNTPEKKGVTGHFFTDIEDSYGLWPLIDPIKRAEAQDRRDNAETMKRLFQGMSVQ